MKKIFFTILIILINKISFANENKIDFKFTTDQNLTTVEEPFITDEKKSILSDDYLNKPITRLDYFLMQFKAELDDQVLYLNKVFNNEYIDVYFKRHKDVTGREEKFDDHDFSSRVFFNEKKGKILIGINISDIGEPLTPLSELCEMIIKYDLRYVAMAPDLKGNWYQNVILNELFKGDDYRNYDKIFMKIAENISFYVSLVSDYDDKMYNVSCFRDNGSDDIKYSTWSTSLK